MVLLIREIREALVDVTVENRFFKIELAPKILVRFPSPLTDFF